MKTLFTSMFLALSTSVWANHPDSVYVKAYNPSPSEGLQISYSVDCKNWIAVGNQNLFKSDYGPWGSEKKMHTPVLRYDNGMFYAEFIPNPNHPQIATTQSADLYLWKPQDYPFLSKEAFEKKKAELEAASRDNIIKVPYKIVENLVAQLQAAKLRGQMDGERLTIKAIDDYKGKVATSLDVRLDDTKAISPELFGIFFEDINYSADGGLYAELIQNRDFEYNKLDRGEWNAKTSWRLEGKGTEWTISDEAPIHRNNPH